MAADFQDGRHMCPEQQAEQDCCIASCDRAIIQKILMNIKKKQTEKFYAQLSYLAW